MERPSFMCPRSEGAQGSQGKAHTKGAEPSGLTVHVRVLGIVLKGLSWKQFCQSMFEISLHNNRRVPRETSFERKRGYE